jgi:hypothetical protein
MAVSINGTRAGQTLTDLETIAPFSIVMIAHSGSSRTDMATLLSDPVGSSVVAPATGSLAPAHGDLARR